MTNNKYIVNECSVAYKKGLEISVLHEPNVKISKTKLLG